MPARRVTVEVTLPDALYRVLVSFAERKGFTLDQCMAAAAAELLRAHDPVYARKRRRAPTFIEMLLKPRAVGRRKRVAR